MIAFIARIFLYFLIYSFLGWIWEILVTLVQEKKFINRGFLNGPYCPIYGVGAIILISLQLLTDRPIELFFLGGILCCILEYIVSYGMEKIFKARWWDYNHYPLNINGRVCLYGFLAFAAFSVLLLYLQPQIERLVYLLPNLALYITSGVLLALFIADIAATNTSMVHLNQILREYQKQLKKNGFVRLITKNRFVMLLTKQNKLVKAFSLQQKRIIDAFPEFKSTKYEEALERLRLANLEFQKKFKATKFKPQKVKTSSNKKKKTTSKSGKK